jgi:hypothetical protein
MEPANNFSRQRKCSRLITKIALENSAKFKETASSDWDVN